MLVEVVFFHWSLTFCYLLFRVIFFYVCVVDLSRPSLWYCLFETFCESFNSLFKHLSLVLCRVCVYTFGDLSLRCNERKIKEKSKMKKTDEKQFDGHARLSTKSIKITTCYSDWPPCQSTTLIEQTTRMTDPLHAPVINHNIDQPCRSESHHVPVMDMDLDQDDVLLTPVIDMKVDQPCWSTTHFLLWFWVRSDFSWVDLVHFYFNINIFLNTKKKTKFDLSKVFGRSKYASIWFVA